MPVMRFILCLYVSLTAAAHAETVPPPRALGCFELEALQPDYTARELAGAVRACVGQERHDAAVAMFVAYNSTAVFDQQRVRDESAHIVVQELNTWVFTGYSRDQIAALKEYIALFRTQEGPFYETVCRQLRLATPPNYRPSYMIARGEIPRKHAEDWRVEEFDPVVAWDMAISQVNGCPVLKTND